MIAPTLVDLLALRNTLTRSLRIVEQLLAEQPAPGPQPPANLFIWVQDNYAGQTITLEEIHQAWLFQDPSHSKRWLGRCLRLLGYRVRKQGVYQVDVPVNASGPPAPATAPGSGSGSAPA